MTEQKNRQFADKLAGRLEQECEPDAAIASRLRQAREAALDQLASRNRRRKQWFAGGLVSATALALVVGILVGGGAAVINEDNADVMEIVAANESLDMYDEMEFYDWLTEQRTGAG